jgi:hypothetical protein
MQHWHTVNPHVTILQMPSQMTHIMWHDASTNEPALLCLQAQPATQQRHAASCAPYNTVPQALKHCAI